MSGFFLETKRLLQESWSSTSFITVSEALEEDEEAPPLEDEGGSWESPAGGVVGVEVALKKGLGWVMMMKWVHH